MTTIAFIALTLLLLSVPLLPAIHEFFAKTDIEPLRVPIDQDNDPRRFALNFKLLVEKVAGDYLSHCSALSLAACSQGFRAMDPVKPVVIDRDSDSAFICRTSVTIAQRAWIRGEVYSRVSIRCRRSSNLRTLLAERMIALAPGVTVLRWAHANVVFAVDKNELYGRLTADTLIHIGNRAIFERLNAPTIRFGKRRELAQARRPLPDRTALDPAQCGAVATQLITPRRVVFSDDAIVPANSIVVGDLVARGNLRIGDNVKIIGSVKSRATLFIGRDCEISGSAVAQKALFVGRRSRVLGPTVGERRVVLGSGCRIGALHALTSVTAERIDVHSDVEVHGTVWAKELGHAVGRLSRR
jgi:cytoskeletal protein CcmA (bactofilin family)